MDNNFKVDPSVISGKDKTYDTNTISEKYNIKIYETSEPKELYKYDIENYLYTDSESYQIKLGEKEVAFIYTEPQIYEPEVPNIIEDTLIIWQLIIIVQIIVIGYYLFKIGKKVRKGNDNAKNNNQNEK